MDSVPGSTLSLGVFMKSKDNDKYVEEINHFIGVISANVQKVGDVSNMEDHVVKNIYINIGIVTSLLGLVQNNSILNEEKNKLYKSIYNFIVDFDENKTEYSRLLHYVVNKLSSQYDMLTESYIEKPDEVLVSFQDFTDYYLVMRDQLEHILCAMEYLDQIKDHTWLDRMKLRINRTDKELKSIFPSLLKKIKKEDNSYFWMPEHGNGFWWRTMEQDYLE